MKKTLAVTLVLLLTVALFTGCGCRNSKPAETIMPTTAPTTAPTTQPTVPSTSAATEDTIPSTIEDGNGPLTTEDTTSTSPTDDTGASGNSAGKSGANMPVG